MAALYFGPCAPLISIGVGFMFFEHLARYPHIRSALCGVNILCAGLTMRHPPTPSPLFNYIAGLLSIIHIVRTIEILFVFNPQSMKRLRKIGSCAYAWEPLPPSLSFRRLVWIVDILSNPRSIGWSHGYSRYLPPKCQILDKNTACRPLKATGIQKIDCRYFPWNQLRRLVVIYLWFDFYHALFVHGHGQAAQNVIDQTAIKLLGEELTSAMSQTLYIWLARIAWVISVHFFFDACHAFITLIAVGIFTESWLGTAGEPWAYPALFGGFRLSTPNLKDFWANWWHDLLRRPFWSVAGWLFPSDRCRTRYFWAIFLMSGTAHGAGSYTASQDALRALKVCVGFSLQPVATIYQQKSVQWLYKDLGTLFTRLLIVWIIEAASSIIWVLCIVPWQFDDPSQEAPFSFLRLPVRMWCILSPLTSPTGLC